VELVETMFFRHQFRKINLVMFEWISKLRCKTFFSHLKKFVVIIIFVSYSVYYV